MEKLNPIIGVLDFVLLNLTLYMTDHEEDSKLGNGIYSISTCQKAEGIYYVQKLSIPMRRCVWVVY